MILQSPFPSPADSPDVQEALSRRYGEAPFMVLPLASGRIAVLGFQRELHAIVDTIEEMAQAGSTIPMVVWQRRQREKDEAKAQAKAAAPQGGLKTSLSAEDLGL